MITESIKNIKTASGEKEFQIRIFKEEGVGILTTKNEENYLTLDSIEYWYDLIQDEYPKKKKCNCKNEWFLVDFKYSKHKETDDIKEIKVATTCTSCGKVSIASTIDIDYAPTDVLLSMPITFCQKPNIKYKYSELTSFWTHDDLAAFIRFTMSSLNLKAYCWYFKMPENKRVLERLTIEDVLKKNGGFLTLFLTMDDLELNKITKGENEGGLLIDDDFWRKHETIKVSSIKMYEIGPLYYIHFCSQYINQGQVLEKSIQFGAMTMQLEMWLKNNFTTQRGTKCHDSQTLYEKYLAKNNPGKPKS